jgi:D-alanine-D-alanine ligase
VGDSGCDVEVRLRDLQNRLLARSDSLAVFLVYDRPERVLERPDLDRVFFAQRCVSDAQLEETIDAFRSVGAYVELFEGEQPFIAALASGRLDEIGRDIKVVYNGIEGGITVGGFQPGRKALLPAVADSYGLVCSNSNAYACAIGRHKFHYLTVLRSLGIATPATWHYRENIGWAGGQAPTAGVKVIVKSTYESWSVGVTEESIFVVDKSLNERVRKIAGQIGQPVTVQEFIPGAEVCIPVFCDPDPFVTPPVRAVMEKAPDDDDAVMTVDDNLRQGGVAHEPYIGSTDVHEQMRRDALAAFDILQLEAFARIDFRVDREGRTWLFDVGVSPGISRKSSAFRSVSMLGLDHAQFLRVVLATTLSTQNQL